ncbi:MAG: selenoprotein O, partial [Alphaproteobacteria bacterium]|nr:selenoprotein O [Alphaproteobacteria bacterium]
FTAAYFDEIGLYSFGRQPGALGWNLSRLAECLIHLTGPKLAEEVLATFPGRIQQEFRAALLNRLGLASAGEEADAALAKAFVDFLTTTKAPFEQAFFDWRGGLASTERAKRSPSAAHYEAEAFAPVRAALAQHRPAPNGRLDHPYFQRETPCTMLIDEVEALWTPIAENDDWAPLYAKIAAIDEMRSAYKS